MKKLALCLICTGAFIVPNICSAKDSEAIDHFDPMTSFEVVLKAPSVNEIKKPQQSEVKQASRKKSSKATLTASN